MNTQTLPQAISEAIATLTAPYLGTISPKDIQVRLSQPKQEDDLLTIREVQNRLHISLATAHRMLADGRLKKVKIGRSVRIPQSAVNAMIRGEEG